MSEQDRKGNEKATFLCVFEEQLSSGFFFCFFFLISLFAEEEQ